MTKRHLGRADLVGEGIERAAAQARAQRAGGLAFRDLLLDHRVGVLLDDVILDADGLQVVWQHVLGKAGLLLVHVHRDDFEADRRNLLQVEQHVEHGVAVLAARQADHDLVTILDHVEIGDCLAGQAAQTLLQFVLVDRKVAHVRNPGEMRKARILRAKYAVPLPHPSSSSRVWRCARLEPMNDELEPEMDLAEQILVLLREQPEGCSEYQLIQQLKARHSTHVPHLPLIDKLVLFRTHFLVFNALYELRDRLWQAASHSLHISPLCIQLRPYVAATSGVVQPDPLRAYYLDMANLRDTDEEEVERLLASFWTRMRGGYAEGTSEAWDPEKKRAALELFELDQTGPALDLPMIKRRYRQLVSIHHPDRGGSTTRIQSINLAMEILQRYYQ